MGKTAFPTFLSPMRPLPSLLLSFAALVATPQNAVGAMALMDLDSKQILQQEGNQIFITDPLSEQISNFLGTVVPPIKKGETTTANLVARFSEVPDQHWESVFSGALSNSNTSTAPILITPIATACSDVGCDGIYLSQNPLGNGIAHRLLALIFGSDSKESLEREASVFLQEGHLRYKTTTIVFSNKPIGHVPVFKGRISNVTLVTHEDVVITLPKTVTLSSSSEAFTMHLTHQQPIVAPVDTETQLGTLNILLNKHCLRSIPVYASETIKEGSFWQRVWDTIKLTITDINKAEKSR